MGMCLGGLLAVELCKRENHRKGRLVSLAAPVFIDGWSTPWYRGLRHLVYRIPGLADGMRVEEEEPYGLKNELVRSIVRLPERGENFHYRWVPCPASGRSTGCAAGSCAAWTPSPVRR